jgi:hypothetical protein
MQQSGSEQELLQRPRCQQQQLRRLLLQLLCPLQATAPEYNKAGQEVYRRLLCGCCCWPWWLWQQQRNSCLCSC